MGAPSSWTNFVFLGIVIVVLLLARDRFTARMQKGNGWKALGTYVVLVAVATLIGFALLMAFPHTLSTVTDRLAWALDNVLGGLTTTSEPDVLGRGPHWVTFVCGLMGAIAIVVAAFVLFRPSPGRRSLDATDEQRVRAAAGAATATRTPSATSPPAATRPSSSRPTARRPSPTG